MFHSILSGRHFAHVYLPGSSASTAASKSSDGKEENEAAIDNVRTYNYLQKRLSGSSPLYGTLLRITDP